MLFNIYISSSLLLSVCSIWDWKNARREVNFEDARSLASNKWNLDDVCIYTVSGDQLL